MAFDTLMVFAGAYPYVASAETDDNLGKEFHPEEGLMDAYDAAVIRRRKDGKGFDPRSDSGVLARPHEGSLVRRRAAVRA